MDKFGAGTHTEMKAKTETGLGKTFLIGMATPLMSIFCTFARRERPNWVTKEFMYTARPFRNACYALGLVTGMSGIGGAMFTIEKIVIDELMSPSKQQSVPASSPKKLKEGEANQQVTTNILQREMV